MRNYDQVIIGAGLSGLAAGIRLARFGSKVLILEKHAVPGGLNSYYTRQGRLLETGLHAMTNYAAPGVKHAPLNRLLRQLKISRRDLAFCEQLRSTILFSGGKSLSFTNDPTFLAAEVARVFPGQAEHFKTLVDLVRNHDPFQPRPWTSAREKLQELLGDQRLIDMLLWPVMIYGNSNEHDMDFDQFVIMFSALYLEGMFRPRGSIRDFLQLLLDHFRAAGGELRLRAPVARFGIEGERVTSVVLENGEEIGAGQVISTAGYPATLGFMGQGAPTARAPYEGKMSFVEIINVLPASVRRELRHRDETIIFFNFDETFDYRCPDQAVNINCGVICFPDNFHDLPPREEMQIRVTHPANYRLWRGFSPAEYLRQKELWAERSAAVVAETIGNYRQNILYQDVFTPVTVERFTGKVHGAIYGSPVKLRDGRTPLANLFVAGTDQGYLGIVGAMLSGVTMVNQHIFSEAG